MVIFFDLDATLLDHDAAAKTAGEEKIRVSRLSKLLASYRKLWVCVLK